MVRDEQDYRRSLPKKSSSKLVVYLKGACLPQSLIKFEDDEFQSVLCQWGDVHQEELEIRIKPHEMFFCDGVDIIESKQHFSQDSNELYTGPAGQNACVNPEDHVTHVRSTKCGNLCISC